MPTYPTHKAALAMLAATTMRPFTENDWDCFAGCETANPTIGEFGDYLLVRDGDVLNLLAEGDEGGGELYNL